MISTETPVTDTERKIAEMLLENTGAAMMDSGGIYGRGWQTMRARFGLDGGLPNSSFSGGPGHTPIEPTADDIERVAAAMKTGMEASIDSYGSVSINIFFFLTKNLDYDPELNTKWDRFQRIHNYGVERYDREWGYSVIPLFLEQLAKHGTVSGLYGDGEPLSENSYNGESSLSDVIQYTYFTFEPDYTRANQPEILPGDTYVLLQIHRGADVRGGYTEPYLFRVMGEEWFSYNDAWITCQEHLPTGVVPGQIGTFEPETKTIQHSWYTDDGYNWYPSNDEPEMKFDSYDSGDTKIHPTRDEDNEQWLCPLDGTKLEVYA